MSFFSFRQKIYPLIALFAGAVVLVFGLIGAKTVIASYFLLVFSFGRALLVSYIRVL